ncbi:GLPGLI family protein [Chryseobacterium sp.]|uniref:GLPGLI family protein n=1 Tax=Chryseobacterium sp. TaxID=1871047 RepID=UPI002899FD33|nr:GLPGLI family protein [Chryseobacterium sp.]
MKKLCIGTFLLVLTIFQAQTNRFFYDYKFVPNINDKADVKTEMMVLDIDAKGSSYFSHATFVADSIQKADIEKQLQMSPGNINIKRNEKPGQITFKVTKSYPEFKTFLYRKVAGDQYKIAEDSKPEWKISSEKQKIGDYNTQKATTSFGGREWIAWFTQEIPFQDGPYKFYGLPGLIVKLEDVSGTHIMTLAGNKKIIAASEEKELNMPSEVRVFGMGGKEIEVTEDQFRKVWKAYVNDPTKNMREMMSKNTENSRVVFKTKTADGREISDPNQVFREMEKNAKESFKKNNNPIEPDLQK